jgi:hypothetical protein
VAGQANVGEQAGKTGRLARKKQRKNRERPAEEPQSARKAALPQNCLTAVKIVPLSGRFVNTSQVICQLINGNHS